MKPIKLIVIVLMLGSLSSLSWSNLPLAAPTAVTATLLPNALVSTQGTTIGTVSALAFRDQSGVQNTPTRYVQFETLKAVYAGYRTFYLPASIDPTNISTMALNVNYRGPLPAAQSWTWSLYNWQSKTWVKVGTNAPAIQNRWTMFKFNIPAPFTTYIGNGGMIRLNLQSNNHAGNAWLDYESITVTYNALLPSGAWWKPGLVNSWQIQYAGTINTSLNVDVYNLDGFETSQATVDALHARGIKVMCYFSAGSWEDWRPDRGLFPKYVLGQTLSGWPDEKWLDIRRLDILGPIMTARIQMCRSKDFDGIDPDNIDAYTNSTGLPLTYQDQLNYNLFLESTAHSLGLAAGLKNDIDQIPILVNYFDWELNEECFYYNECNTLQPFIAAGKPVFNIEYNLSTSAFCPQANALNFNSLKKNLNLDAYRVPCR
jgi:hypothetical protein